MYLYMVNLRGILSREKVLLSNDNETDYAMFYSFCEAHKVWFLRRTPRGTIDYLLFCDFCEGYQGFASKLVNFLDMVKFMYPSRFNLD